MPVPPGRPLGEVRVEPLLTVHDTAANVIVTARPDVLYVEDGSWVWRETKSMTRPPRPGTDLLEEFPQLALGMIMLAETLLEGKPRGCGWNWNCSTPTPAT